MSDPHGTQRRPDFAAPGQPSQPGQPHGRPSQYGPGPGGQPNAAPAAGHPLGGQGPFAGPAAGPGAYPQPYRQVVERDARPAMLTLSAVLIITGSLLWITEVGLVWITAFTVRNSFSFDGVEGVFYHLLNRFHLRMLEQGLGLALFGFPTAAIVFGFLLLIRKPWPRIAINVLGAAAIGCTALLLRDDPLWVIPFATYIAFSCLILWAPSVTRWCSPNRPGEPVAGRMGP